jgi:hypothetical protein
MERALARVQRYVAHGHALAKVLLAEQIQDRFHGQPELHR